MRRSTEPIGGVLLDAAYSQALIGEAMRTGYARFNVEMRPSEANHLLERSAYWRYRQGALDLAALYDSVHLTSVMADVDTSVLEAEGLVRLRLNRAGAISDVPDYGSIPPAWLQFVQASLMPEITRQVAKQSRFLAPDADVPRKTWLRSTYRSLVMSANAFDFPKLHQAVGQIVTQPMQIMSENCPYREELLELMSPYIRGYASQNPGRAVACAAVVLAAFTRTILDTWMLFTVSIGFDLPLASRLDVGAVISADDSINHGDVLGVYRLCQIEMHRLDLRVPVVESIPDVLRLREHPSVRRFRELLVEWTSALKDEGEARALSVIGRDLEKASHEFERLEKWKRLDNLMLWAELPVSLIPIVGQLMSIVSVATELRIRHVERRHSWVAIGR